MYRLGWLGLSTPESGATDLEAFREVGYVKGPTYTIEGRWAEGKVERLPELEAELVRAEPKVSSLHGRV